ncbi:hypothetical protein Pcinc_037833 [Petrolisthes cinctipes]|uniref:Uncharacterized protein n=1 Tax=Petrolisthes cinctipes TaxID=88211 RepID=A0AAE1BRN6_PETCI|nr:hypothetical protein Pcinc_037833 [Petrolisthes cinctipes]
MRLFPRSKPPKKQRKDHWFYDQRVRVLNNRLNAARRLYRRHPTDTNRALLREVVHHTRQEKKSIQEQKWIEWCQSIDSHTSLSSMWSKLRAVSGKKFPAPPSHRNPQLEAEHLASSFAMRSSSTQLPDPTIHALNRLQQGRERAIELACLAKADTDPPITSHELIKAEKRSRDTAPGRDQINLLKTKSMTFGKHPPEQKLIIFGTEIDWVGCHQYLGIFVDSPLTFRAISHT